VTGKRKWVLRVGLAAAVALVGTAAWAFTHLTELKAAYAARQLRHAGTDEDRAKAADRLAALADPGAARLIDFIRTGEDAHREAAAAALTKLLDTLPDGDARAVAVGARLHEAFPACDAGGQRAVLALLPAVLAKTGGTHAAKCREAVAAAVKSPDAAARVLAARVAMHPDVKMRAELVPLLNAPEPEVRRAALFAVATVTDGELVADEDLFRWLHDPDAGVRAVCRDALVGRDRSEAEINLGWRLVAPDPGERLKLLLDLRYDDDVADPEPWLERLSRDPEPAVRAGAARVAIEVTRDRRQTCPGWVARVAEADADPTVRRVAAYFHRQMRRAPTPTSTPRGSSERGGRVLNVDE
jgi:hypothetical protein